MTDVEFYLPGITRAEYEFLLAGEKRREEKMQEHLAICFEVEPGLFQLVDQASGEEIAKTQGTSSLKGTAEVNGWLEVHDRDEREYKHRYGEGYRSTYVRAERIPGHVTLPEEPVVILDVHPSEEGAAPAPAPVKKETAAEKKKREKAEKEAAEKAAAEAAAKEQIITAEANPIES